MAGPTVSFTCGHTSGGTLPASLRVIALVKWLAMIEPNTATPTAPPIWRVVSFTADPTPALARGSEPMIESVHGAMTFAMPIPRSMVMRITCSTLLFGWKVVNSTSDVVTSTNPAATTILLPSLCTHTLDSGAQIMINAACGNNTAPALTVE